MMRHRLSFFLFFVAHHLRRLLHLCKKKHWKVCCSLIQPARMIMMKTAAAVLLLSTTVQAQGECPQATGEMSFAGASTLQRLTTAWVESWARPGVAVTNESGGSSAGIATVCGTSQTNPTDVGGMTRMPFESEAGTENGFTYKCERSTRSVLGVRSSSQACRR